jgi:hypothetical protein
MAHLNYGESAPVTINLTIAYDNANQTPEGTGVGTPVGRNSRRRGYRCWPRPVRSNPWPMVAAIWNWQLQISPKRFLGNDTLRDYTHASRTFTTNTYELKPRFKFLISCQLHHQRSTDSLSSRCVWQRDDISNLSLLVKTVDLPKYNIATETLNQYNRKRIYRPRN